MEKKTKDRKFRRGSRIPEYSLNINKLQLIAPKLHISQLLGESNQIDLE